MQHLLSAPVRRARRAVVAALLAAPLSMQAQTPASRAAGDTVRLSLDQAVTLGLRQSDEIGLANAQIDVADAQYANARASILPQLRFNGAYTHVYESARGNAVGSVFNQPNTYTASTNLSQTLFQGGRLVSAARAANDSRQAAREDEQEQRASVTMQVQRAYLQALYTARIVELQEEQPRARDQPPHADRAAAACRSGGALRRAPRARRALEPGAARDPGAQRSRARAARAQASPQHRHRQADRADQPDRSGRDGRDRSRPSKTPPASRTAPRSGRPS